MTYELHLRVAGLLQLAIATMHAPLPKWFNWREELSRLSLLNRQIFLVHNLFIVLVLVLLGAMSLLAPGAIMERSSLGEIVCAGIGFFWLVRLLVQFFVYDPKLWRGDPLRTRIHIGVSLLWCYLAAVYILAFWWHVSG